MIQILQEKDCCGCGACSIACPKNCITMEERSLGHLFPSIDYDKCVNCGKCERVCPMLSQHNNEDFTQKAFAAYARNSDVRFEGSSGGMFGVFARKLMECGFVVYGAAFDERLKLKCTLAETKDKLHPLCKSKYLQSELTGKYIEIESRLKKGDKVLFVSTPCQVYALKQFLSKEYKNLTTIDFFCHGVPSQKFFDQCIELDRKRLGGDIKHYEFRTKKKRGSTPHYFTEVIEGRNGDKTISDLYFESPFYAVFQKYINLRESCYHCKFAGQNRVSDITIGDFHDIDKYVRGINRFDGVSTVIVNTEKGNQLWNNCHYEINAQPMDLNQLILDGVCFGSGTERPSRRDEFLKDYQEMTMENLIRKWADPSQYWKQRIYYSMPSFLRKLIKRFMGE